MLIKMTVIERRVKEIVHFPLLPISKIASKIVGTAKINRNQISDMLLIVFWIPGFKEVVFMIICF